MQSDIDMEAGHLHVRRTLARTRGGHTFQPVKTHRLARRIVLPRDCVTSLKRYRDTTGHRPPWGRRHLEESGLVFTTGIGTPVDPAAVYRHQQDICRLADVRYIRFHDLRHTCATLLREQRVDPVTIEDLLGHAQIHTTADVSSTTSAPSRRLPSPSSAATHPSAAVIAARTGLVIATPTENSVARPCSRSPVS